MKRQRYGKVYPGPDASSYEFRHRNNVQIPSGDLWMTPYGYPGTDSHQGSEVVPRDSENKFQKKSPSDEDDSLHIVVAPLILLGQCFGLLPVQGILSSSAEDLTFNWFSPRVVYAVVFIFLNLIFTVGQLYSAAVIHGFTFYSIDNVLVSAMTTTQGVIFLQQARTLPVLMTHWTRVERRMSHFHPLVGLASTVRHLVYVFFICSLLLMAARFTSTLTRTYDCSDSLSMALNLALLLHFNALPVSSTLVPARTLLLAFLFVQEAVVSVYDELTIIVLAYSLCLRFRQLNSHLQKVCRQRLPVQYWAELRETYNSLSILAQHLNNHLSWMILVCFGGSLYEICSLIQLILSPDILGLASWTILYVLMFTVLRTSYAALVASAVSEESKKPLYQLFSVPSESYSAEVCRFQMQVTHGDIAISALGFFYVTRSFMLTVAGTIATYEIVLIQFATTNAQNGTSFNNTDFCYNILVLLDQ